MRHPFLLAAIAWWIGIVAAQAQTNVTPGMGPTSPLGVPTADSSSLNSNSSNLGGIPLGATGINTPGVSPLIMPCPNASSNAAFDGGGSALSNNCGSGSATNNGSGVASTSSAGDLNSGSAGSGSGNPSSIPLGATNLATPGESQTTAVPGVSPCLPSVNPSQGSSTVSGPTSSAAVNGGC